MKYPRGIRVKSLGGHRLQFLLLRLVSLISMSLNLVTPFLELQRVNRRLEPVLCY